MNCTQCGGQIQSGTRFCTYCGSPVEPAAQTPPGQNAAQQPFQYAPPVQQPPVQQFQYQPPAPQPKSAGRMIAGIIGLGLSILSVFMLFYSGITFLIPSFAVATFIFSLSGLICGANGIKNAKLPGFGVAGMVIGIIATFFSSILLMVELL